MFLNKYKNYKEKLGEDFLYETEVNGSPLFKTESSNEVQKKNVELKAYETIKKDLIRTEKKFKFILNFLREYKETLTEKNILLDNNLNNLYSKSENFSNSFISLINSEIDANHIVKDKIIYSKNVVIKENKVYKVSTDEVSGKEITYPGKNKILIKFEEKTYIDTIIANFYNDVTVSFYALLEDGNYRSFSKQSGENLFIFNPLEEKVLGVLMESVNEIKYLTKSVYITDGINDQKTNEYGLIAYEIEEAVYDELFVENNSLNNFYRLSKKDFKIFSTIFNENQEKAVLTYLTTNQQIEKNKLIEKSDEVIVELFKLDTTETIKTKFYGKEQI